jgi:hypothetical protein
MQGTRTVDIVTGAKLLESYAGLAQALHGDYFDLPPEIPFGGCKHSGVGRENGLQTINEFTQIKTIYTNLGAVRRVY